MAKVWQFLKNETDNLGEKNENLLSSADVLHETSNLSISRCCFADDRRQCKWTKMRKARAECVNIFFLLSNIVYSDSRIVEYI